MRQPYSRTLLIGIFLALLPISALALDPRRQISQYAHTAWRIQDGFFNGTPQSITQTADGYLWIGTEAGLVRFDGVRFILWTGKNGERLPSSRIHAVLGARDGSLWIGTSRGLAKWKNQALVTIQGEAAFIESIVELPDGKIWITRSQVHDSGGPLCEVLADALRCRGKPAGISFPFAQPLLADGHQNLWFGSALGIAEWRANQSHNYPIQSLHGNDGQPGVAAIAENSDGSMLVGIRRTGKGLGLQEMSQGVWHDFKVPGLDGPNLGISALLRDHDDGVWIGTGTSGIYRVHGTVAEQFTSADGLSSDSVQAFYEDREGSLWVATSRGLDRFHEIPVVSYSIREGLKAEDADSVLAARDGSIWIGNVQSLDVLRGEKVSSITRSQGLPGRLVTSLLEDDQGRTWAGVDNRLMVYEHGQFHPVNKNDGKPVGIVTSLVEDSDHNIWAAVTEPALYRIRDLKVQEEFDPPQVPRVASMTADPNGGIWLGLSSGALVRFRQGQFQTLPTHRPQNHAVRNLFAESPDSIWGATQDGALLWSQGKEQVLNSHNGLPCDDVYTLLKDNRGALWLDTQCGFVVIDLSEIQRWIKQRDVQLTTRTLDVFDGAQPGLTNFRPEASKSPDGKLWFANENIVQTVDPEHMHSNPVPPPVHVEQIIADRKNYSALGTAQLPPLTRDIEIDYTALSLVAPQKVRFRYKLEGHDTEWQDPQNRRQAFYSNLPPGHYRFHVIAGNNDGVWNEAGADVGFAVLPAFYQTIWFRIFCIVAAAFTLCLFYLLRLRNLAERMQSRFDERLKERERIARNLHDTLLQGIYSATIHFDLANNRLQDDSPAKPAVQRGLELLRHVSQEGRKALRSLRSAEASHDDLEHALSRLPKEFALPEDVDFVVATEGQPRVLRPLVRDEAYLIAREAIMNSFRHSRATKIEVDVEYASRELRILVRDNGSGIDADILKTGRDGHWGMAGMRERAEKIGATLDVLSRVNAGTEVQLSVPGVRAFQDSPARQSWGLLSRLYPGRRTKNQESREEQPK